MRRARQHGLSLVEMLVVMVLVSMVATLLVQGLGNAMALYQRINADQFQRYHESMLLDWFRSVVADAVPNQVGEDRFVGDQYQLQLASYQPLLGDAAVNGTVQWSVSATGPYQLRYWQGDAVLELPLQAAQRPSLAYLDEEGHWQPTWPIAEGSYRLPRAVRLSLGERDLTVVLRSHRQAHFYPDELLYGRE